MRQAAVVLNWLGIAAFGIGAIGLTRFSTSLPWPAYLIPLLPYVLALLALRPPAARALQAVALAVNALWVGLALTLLISALTGGVASPAIVVPVAVVLLLAPSGLNVICLFNLVRAKLVPMTANNALERARDE